jgi:hypothetical protein
MALELEVPDHRRAQQPGHIGRPRNPISGPEFLGDASAAEKRSALQDQRPTSGPREVRCSHQSVVAATDYHDVEAHRTDCIATIWPPMEIQPLDIAAAGIIAAAGLRGLFIGLLREGFSLASLACA